MALCHNGGRVGQSSHDLAKKMVVVSDDDTKKQRRDKLRERATGRIAVR